MKLPVSSRVLAFAATVTLLLVVNSAVAEDCSGEEEQLEFTFFLDEDSLQENGWALTCDGVGTIWDVPVGTLEASGSVQFADVPVVKDQICISKNATCHFTLEDTFGDGILFPGYYYLTYGATTLVVSEDGEEFYEKVSCFGSNCPIAAQEIVEECDDIYLFFEANSSPEQSSVQIVCNGEIKFSKSDFTVAQEIAEFEACIPNGGCCTLLVYDSAFDGLEGGHVFLEWANQVIFSYDDSNPFEFGTVSRSFGSDCPETVPEEPSQGFEPEEGDGLLEPPIVSGRSEAGGNEVPMDETVSNIHEESSLQKGTSMSTGAIVAMVVVGSLVVIGGVVILLACCCNSSSTNSARITKDLDVQSMGSKDTDLEEVS